MCSELKRAQLEACRDALGAPVDEGAGTESDPTSPLAKPHTRLILARPQKGVEMSRYVFRLALGGLALYFYSQGNIFWAVLCILVIAWSFLQQQLALLVGSLRRLTSIPQEHDANSVLTYTFRLDRVFEHPAVDDVFAKLHKNHKAPAQTLEEWRKLLAESYARRYRRDDLVCEVRFNIKNNVLFVNGEPDFGDHVYHELEIPYRSTDAGKPEEARFFTPDIEAQLSVRMLLLNGMLLLQVGRFSKEYSSNILHGGSLAVYETYATVTSFPLMYFSDGHGIPVRYLNLIAEATPSYKASHAESGSKNTRNMYGDWRTLQQEVAAYRVLCDSDNENYSHDVLKKLWMTFEAKRAKFLAAEGYKKLFEGSSEDAWRYPDTGHEYWNEYGRVTFRNMNANRDSRHEARWFADYYEEEP